MIFQNKRFLLQDKYKHCMTDILNRSEISANLYDPYFSFTNFYRGNLRQFYLIFITQYQTKYVRATYCVSEIV